MIPAGHSNMHVLFWLYWNINATLLQLLSSAILCPGRNQGCQAAYKPGSVPRAMGAAMTIHLGRRLPDASCGLPGQRAGGGLPNRALSCLPCSRWGLPCRSRYRKRGGLLPHHFTLTRRTGGLFSVALSLKLVAQKLPLGISLAGRYPAPCLRGARTFLTQR